MTVLSGLAGAVLVTVASGSVPATQPADLSTQLMLSTFKVANAESTGTGFILRRPLPASPSRTQYILVTAEHTFSKAKGNEMTLTLRKEEGEDKFVKRSLKIKIRRDDKDLWTKHPSADVAVLVFEPPSDVSIPAPSVDLLADDTSLKESGVRPGELIRSMGYPHANQFDPSEAGFSTVRIGCIASYPLLPTRQTRTFLGDFNTFEGDSGGPVYLCREGRSRASDAGDDKDRPGLILGLISGQHWLNEEFKAVYQSATFHQRLGLAIIVHASAIKETIDLLPHD